MQDRERREPIFLDIPWSLGLWLGSIALVHALRQLLPADLDERLVLALAFIPARYGSEGVPIPGGVPSMLLSPLTHMLVHGDIAHLLLNAGAMLAYGALLARRLGNARMMLLSVLAGLTGAATFALARPGAEVAMVGASGAASGVLAGSLLLVVSATRQGTTGRLREHPAGVELIPLGAALRDARVRAMTAVFILLNAAIGLASGVLVQGPAIAWEAHVGGFLAGLLLTGALAPPAEPPRP